MLLLQARCQRRQHGARLQAQLVRRVQRPGDAMRFMPTQVGGLRGSRMFVFTASRPLGA
jgi:hypothetical protein